MWPTLFRIDERGIATPDVADGCDWVLRGEGQAVRLWDGRPVEVADGRLLVHHPLPDAALAEATAKYRLPDGRLALRSGWYELIGPSVCGNHDASPDHRLVYHLGSPVQVWPEYFDIRLHCCSHQRALGVLWIHRTDGRRAQITRRDFGYAWPPERKGPSA